MKILITTLFVCSVAACVPEAVEDNSAATSTDDQSIIGGVTDTGDPSVVALFAHPPGSGSGALCTGTVIGPRTVLTAAHCVDPRLIPPGSIIEILSGTTLTLPGIVASSTTFDPSWDPNNLFAGHDIGIVHTTNVLPFPPITMGVPAFNLAVRLVGYGSNTHTNTGAGTKRTVTTNIVAANNILFQDGNSNQQTCHGDSGGPALQVQNGITWIIGVTSFGQDQPPQVCFGGGFHNRTDAFQPFINANTF